MNHHHRLLASLIAACLAGAAAAQDVLLYRAGQTPDARDVARILGRPAAPPAEAQEEDAQAEAHEAQPRTRGFKLVQPAQRAERRPRPPAQPRVLPADAATARADAGGASALALGIQFDFGSAAILPAARAQLDALAEGIKLLAPEQRVVIEGHTDAIGSDEYNLVLSQRRAEAVKQYLTGVHGIDAARLTTIGLGKRQPLDPRDPFAADNRRVQFHGS